MRSPMADVHDMRARIRDSGVEPEQSGNGLSFWIVTICAVAVGFTVVMFAPRLYTAQRTAALPAFRDMPARSPAQAAQGPDVAAPAPAAGAPGVLLLCHPAQQDRGSDNQSLPRGRACGHEQDGGRAAGD